jgi:hypothetical protein
MPTNTEVFPRLSAIMGAINDWTGVLERLRVVQIDIAAWDRVADFEENAVLGTCVIHDLCITSVSTTIKGRIKGETYEPRSWSWSDILVVTKRDAYDGSK